MICEFDGINKIIYINSNEISVEEVYSRWKDWVLKDLNAMFLQAFKQESDNGEIVYYLVNDWKIKPKDKDISLSIKGNLIKDKISDNNGK